MKKWVRLASIPGLIFFVCLISCSPKTENTEISIQWKNEQAVGAIIPNTLVNGIPDDSVSSLIAIQIASQDQPVAILGTFRRSDQGLHFTPLIPFTHGMRYDMRIRGKRAGGFEIPETNADNAPNVTAIYPSADTLPENLLKIYLHFDRPMREGVSGKYVKLIKNQQDTIEGAFLDLQPELWNPERTILTLWLDPGRIKRDLQPNKRLGAPMQRGTHYQILVSQAWTDTRGKQLTKPYQKAFVTTIRDSLTPETSHWTLIAPMASTRQPLVINLKEPLDHSLLQEVFSIQDINGMLISGKWQSSHAEMQCNFIPDKSWQSGAYQLLIEPRLEDLAGNNLVIPFDRNVSAKPESVTGEITLLRFNVK